MTRYWPIRSKQKLYGDFRKSLKRNEADPTRSFCVSCYLEWRCDGWSSTHILGLEVTYTVGAICRNGGKAVLKI